MLSIPEMGTKGRKPERRMSGAAAKCFLQKEAFWLALNAEKGWLVDFSRQAVVGSMEYKGGKKQSGCGSGEAKTGLVVSVHVTLHLAR